MGGDRVASRRALDGAGSWSGASHLGPFWIDTTAPETTIDAAPPAETSERSAAFAFSSEAATSFSCSLDSAASDDCVSPFSYPALPLGGHVFTVTARDRAGNVDQTPAEHRWTIVSAPAPSPPPPPPPPVEPPPPPHPPTPPPPAAPPVAPPPAAPPPAPPPSPPPATQPGPKSAPKKVTLCYRRRTIKVAKSKVKKYRRLGAKLGACTARKRRR